MAGVLTRITLLAWLIMDIKGNPSCSKGEFQCVTGGCIPQAYLCDGDRDCSDGSDEVTCSKPTCSQNGFRCANGGCIPLTYVCDGDRDCNDGSDEGDSCSKPTCSQNGFQCANGGCIPLTYVCDGDRDCNDGSDEGDSCSKPTCSQNGFQCANGGCIPLTYVCDGDRDCIDGSDEGDSRCNFSTDEDSVTGIIGGVVGAVVLLVIVFIGIVVLWFVRKRATRQAAPELPIQEPTDYETLQDVPQGIGTAFPQTYTSLEPKDHASRDAASGYYEDIPDHPGSQVEESGIYESISQPDQNVTDKHKMELSGADEKVKNPGDNYLELLT